MQSIVSREPSPKVVETQLRYTELQKKVLRRADAGEYSILYFAALVGIAVGIGFCLLSYFRG